MSVQELNEAGMCCSICGSGSIRLFAAHAHDAAPEVRTRIRECLSCNFAWQFPRGRTPEESAEWFRKSYEDKNHARSEYFDENRKREIALLEIDFVASLKPSGQRLLDIGAGAGVFAEVAAEKGWQVTAVDPSINEDRFRDNIYIQGIKGSIDRVPAGQLFDVVTMWDVIEHADKPVDLLNQAKRLLKHGGWLIIETGNYKSAERVAGGLKHWIYQLDHRWYFSPDSLEKLLGDCGFEGARVAGKSLRPGWNGTVSYQGPTIYRLLKSIVKHPFSLTKHLANHCMLIKAKSWQYAGIGIFALAARKK